MDKIRILIVDDHPLMREALRDAIESEDDIEVAGEAVNGLQAVEMAAKLNPQLVLMDLFMPVMDGIEATRRLVHEFPGIKILVITSSNEDEKVIAAIRAGATGYILKDASRERILAGVCEVSQGSYFVPAEIGAKLANAVHAEQTPSDPLTPREIEIMNYVGKGSSNAEIASTLVLSEGTVRVHISNIIGKLNLKNRSQLAIYAQKRNKG
jgi:NarL family two-component system response regulator LiaR